MSAEYKCSDAMRDSPQEPWVVEVIRVSDRKCCARIPVTRDLLPPRLGVKGKIAWALPTSPNAQPRLGLHEQKVVVAEYRRQRKEKKEANREASKVVDKDKLKLEKRQNWAARTVQKQWRGVVSRRVTAVLAADARRVRTVARAQARERALRLDREREAAAASAARDAKAKAKAAQAPRANTVVQAARADPPRPPPPKEPPSAPAPEPSLAVRAPQSTPLPPSSSSSSSSSSRLPPGLAAPAPAPPATYVPRPVAAAAASNHIFGTSGSLGADRSSRWLQDARVALARDRADPRLTDRARWIANWQLRMLEKLDALGEHAWREHEEKIQADQRAAEQLQQLQLRADAALSFRGMPTPPAFAPPLPPPGLIRRSSSSPATVFAPGPTQQRAPSPPGLAPSPPPGLAPSPPGLLAFSTFQAPPPPPSFLASNVGIPGALFGTGPSLFYDTAR